MTDTTASSASPDPQGNPLSYNAGEAVDQPVPSAGDGWETVTFPGQRPLVHGAEIAEAEGWLSASDSSADRVDAAEPDPEDLVQLIQDLNQCNDALLLRVTELEEALERSQVALQAEIERTQNPPGGLPGGVTPGPVQQQIAQLLSELDIANDGLRRTTIHNETLQAELEVNQQRVAQLERECTLLQQRFGEKNTALHQAEETCRDLKARLHRQQRYTLQFKAALEKCLNMTPAAASAPAPGPTAIQGQLLSPVLEEAGQPVAMPRSQQIQPWSAGNRATSDNPSLAHLLRGLRSAGSSPVSASAIPQTERPPAPEPSPAVGPHLAPHLALPEPVTPVMPAVSPPQPATADPWLQADQPEENQLEEDRLEEIRLEKDSSPPAIAADLGTGSLFTEPSPWGEPITEPPAPAPEPRPMPAAATTPLPQPTRSPQPAAPAASTQAPAPTLPAYLNGPAKASPSPLVYPLRSQKKIASIAAVELPSFGRAVRRRTV
ncbi:hypothetical protein PGN35_024920 [Nodosilinea sp. PGN35]|uniref:hypothetical protein n=1 Tax=Nodosilinea sp. PGN35 TaxID=3020489 RepID=UPI0023B34B2F|nr:hypothetical protein [Nodosilinea sp. TSF1-S3]MDF0369342.1 hypothetical protein [Nodosilinea sp. TSF1-S3]